MNSRFEDLVTALLKGETVDIEPRSRIEQCLKNCIDRTGTDGLPAPQSRVEALLWQLAEQLEDGSGTKKLAKPAIRLVEMT